MVAAWVNVLHGVARSAAVGTDIADPGGEDASKPEGICAAFSLRTWSGLRILPHKLGFEIGHISDRPVLRDRPRGQDCDHAALTKDAHGGSNTYGSAKSFDAYIWVEPADDVTPQLRGRHADLIGPRS